MPSKMLYNFQKLIFTLRSAYKRREQSEEILDS